MHEEYTPEEYTTMYYQKVNELNNMKATLTEGKNQLRQYDNIKETPEIKKLKTRDTLREQIKKLELSVERTEKEVTQLTPVSKKLNE